MLIFSGENGVFQNRRNLLVGEQDAPLQCEAADNLAVVGVKLGDDVGAKILERANLRKVTRINKKQSCQRTNGDRAQQKQGEGNASHNLAPAQAQRDLRQLYPEDFILAQILPEHPKIRRKLRVCVS